MVSAPLVQIAKSMSNRQPQGLHLLSHVIDLISLTFAASIFKDHLHPLYLQPVSPAIYLLF